MYKHILIPTDGSPQSAQAITGAIELAKTIGAKVTGFFAAPPATPIFYRDNLPAGFGTMEDHKRLIEDSAGRYLDIIAQAAKTGRRCLRGRDRDQRLSGRCDPGDRRRRRGATSS